MNEAAKTALRAIGGTLAAATALQIGATVYLYRGAMARNAPGRVKVPANPQPPVTTPQERQAAQEQRKQKDRERAFLKQEQAWLAKQPAEQLFIRNRKGMTLHGTMVKAQTRPDLMEEQANPKYIVASHGWRCSPQRCFGGCARIFLDSGWNLLLVDNRGHGQSDGKYVGMGWNDRLDLVDWCEHLAKEHPDASIVLMGMSMGGAAVMMASGEQLPHQVKGIIEDCGFISVLDEFVNAYPAGTPTIRPLVLGVANLLNRRLQGYSFKESSALPMLAKNRLPLLIIQGTADAAISPEAPRMAAQATSGPVTTLLVEGADHLNSCLHDPDTYREAVIAFLQSLEGCARSTN